MTPRDASCDEAQPIAIIGIGCRFPGGIVDPESFWQLLAGGVDAITSIPEDRFDVERFYDPKPGTRGRVTTRFGGFVNQPLEEFDAAFFGISRSYAERLDPQQRLLLETAWEAMEDAGLDIVALQGSPTGVFVGMWVSDYEHRLFNDTSAIDFQMAMGSGRYAAAGRLSYAFGFRGPSLSIDAACSSGLASVHLAASSLRNGESRVALAGGVNMILEPHIHLAYSYSKMLAADGRCRFADEAGSGYVRSEGSGIVVLKTLADAIADGDRVYAVLRGSAVNNDGNSSGAMGRPSRIGQEELIRKALRDGGVQASQLDYVEAHGTGTRAGDPVELSALGAVLRDGRAADAAPTWVGSVKTNIGHTEAAAGVAGLIKTVLSMQRGLIPPSLHFTTPNTEIPWDELPVAIPTSLLPWPAHDRPRFAGVSSYGIGGTNAHVVLESSPAMTPPRRAPRDDGTPLLLPLSARSKVALRALAGRYASQIETPDVDAYAVCWSTATRRSALPYRAAFVAPDRESMRLSLLAYANGDAATADGVVHDTARKMVAFVVPGQGAQWLGMARKFFGQNHVFRDAMLECDAAASRVVPWSIVAQLHLDAQAHDYIGERIDVIQPTLVAIAIAYAAWLRSIGIVPDAVVGHSLGEVGAAAIAGVINVTTAMRIICLRSALMQRTSGQGAMAVIDLPQADVEVRLRSSGAPVTVAVSNSPRSTVISGAPDAVHAMLAQLDADGVYARLVKVDVASHGSQMDSLVPELVSGLADVRPVAAHVPIYSSVTAQRAHGADFGATYWGRNLRQPVQFTRTVECLLADGLTAFVELGPHAVLSYAVSQTADALGRRDVMTAALGTRETDDLISAHAVVAALWANGAAIDWTAVMPWGSEVVSLPLYPWQRERFWYDTSAAPARRAAAVRETSAHPFLGTRFDAAADDAGVEWEVRFSTSDEPWLLDHVVRGTAIVPAAAMIDVMVAAMRQLLGDDNDVVLRDVSISEAIPLRDEPATLRLLAKRRATDRVALELRVKDEAGWHVVAAATGAKSDTPGDVTNAVSIADGTAPDTVDGARHYARMQRRALSYGPAFQVVTGATTTTRTAAVAMQTSQVRDLVRRVTLLDGALQSLLALAPATFAAAHETLVPVRVDQLTVRAAAWPAAVRATVECGAVSDDGVMSGAAEITDESGRRCISLSGVQMQVVRGAPDEELAALRYRMTWVPLTLSTTPLLRQRWLVVCDAGGVGARAAEQLRSAGHEVREWHANEVSSTGMIPDGTQHVVICTPLDATGADVRAATLDAVLAHVYDAPLDVLQRVTIAAHAPRMVIIVTSGAVAVRNDHELTSPLQGAAWGLARVARHEHPDIGCIVMDVAPDALADALLSGVCITDEAELAWRDGAWWANRVEHSPDSVAPAAPTTGAAPMRYEAEVGTAGVVDTVGWRSCGARPLAAHEVRIVVTASGLNFLDVLGALNAYPAGATGSVSAAPPLGLECTGVVTCTGSDVHHVAVGDAVMAVAEGSLASHAIADAALVVRLPAGVSAVDGSGFPIAFLTAARALEDVARLRAGERVLIHSAAGGVGLAALQIARNLGAEIFATAGTAEKRALLRSMGVAHVFDSRSIDWGDAVLAATGSAGVHVVLNSLAGDAIETGFRVLATYGRFIEIGKRDVFGGTRMDMAVFRKQAIVTSVYLLEQMREDAESLGVLFRDLVARLERGELTLLPTTRWTADQVPDAFHALLPGTHVGKMVIAHAAAPSVVRAVDTGTAVRNDATYLITGGLGSLGQRAAHWLVAQGATCLVLVGRSAPSASVQRVISEWQASGVTVVTLAVDIGTAGAAAELQQQLKSMPPLGGVLHAAGMLDDGLLTAQTPARMRTVAAAKVGGLLELTTLPGILEADFVVLYSSVASALGTRGQANYAAANAILDAAAHSLRARGVRATSIGFGPFAGIGLATEGRRLEILADSGLGALRPVHADMALAKLPGAERVHEIVAAFDANAWMSVHDQPSEQRRLQALLAADAPFGAPVGAARSPAQSGLKHRLAAIPGARQRTDLMLEFVQQEVATVLRTSVDRIEPLKALRSMGIDSLTSLELRNRLEHGTGLRLPGTLVFTYPHPLAIATYLREQLSPASTANAVSAAPTIVEPTSADDELDALAREMSALDDAAVRQLLAERGAGDGG